MAAVRVDSRIDHAPVSGGQGGRFLSTAGLSSDTRLKKRAIRERWPITPGYKARIVRRLRAVVTSTNANLLEVVSAARTLFAADGQNQVNDLTLLKLDRDSPAESKALRATGTDVGPADALALTE